MYVTPNITAQEVLPEEMWNTYGANGLRLMDMRIIEAEQAIRERQGYPRYINTWSLGMDDNRNESGLRILGQEYYNLLSQHSYGRALDSISHDVPHEELWEDILDNPHWYWQAGITVVESINIAPTWLHKDCRAFDYNGNPITELMICDKIEGQWNLFTVNQWKEINDA